MNATRAAERRPQQLLAGHGVDIGRLLESSRVKTPCTVVVPVHNGGPVVGRCLDALLRHTRDARLVVIDDASTDPDTIADLDRRAAQNEFELVRHETNWGYTRSANHALRLGAGGDTVLLNSDTEVGPGWLRGLRAAGWGRPKVATVSALSDNAGAMAMPLAGVPNEWPAHLSWSEIARAVAQSDLPFAMETPTGHGFCMLVTRTAAEQLGGFDEESFPRGYGEENDFCMRARAAGLVNLIAPRVFVKHARGQSFGSQRESLMASAREVLNALHPDYSGLVRTWMSSPGLVGLRESFAALRDQVAARQQVLPRRLYVLHRSGGGTPATNLDLMTALGRSQESYVLESVQARSLELSVVKGGGTKSLLTWTPERAFKVTDTWRQDYAETVARVVLNLGVELVHVRHLINHPLTTLPSICDRLGLPLVISTHDFYLACPTVHLLDNNERFCGGTCSPGAGQCKLPTTFLANAPQLKHSWIYEWRRRVETVLDTADAVIATTDSAAQTLSRAYPGYSQAIRVIEHGRDLDARFAPVRDEGRRPGPPRIMAVAHWDRHKGAHYLRHLAEVLGSSVEFHVLGQRSEQFSDIAVAYGTFQRDQQRELVAEIDPDLSAILSICAETYSHTLTESWALGIPVVATDMGAVAERIRNHGGGLLLPVDDFDEGARLLRQLTSSAAGLADLRARVPRDSIRSRSAMAESYRTLYSRVESAGAASPRVGYVVHGALGAHKASTHVRLLSRLRGATTGERVSSEQVLATDLATKDGLVGLESLIIQRDALGADPSTVLSLARDSGVRLVVDVDDDLFHPDAGSRLGLDAERHRAHGQDLGSLLSGSDGVLVSTPVMADRVLPYVDTRPLVVPNDLDPRLWSNEVRSDPTPDADEWRVLYMGSRTHTGDLEILRPVWDRLQGALDRPVVLELVGVTSSDESESWTRRLEIPRVSRDFPEFITWLRRRRLRWHAAVAPLEDTDFNEAKSDLKLLEYAMLGLPAIASDVGPYRDSELAALTRNETDCWASAIVATLNDREAALARADAAKEVVVRTRMLTRDRLDTWISAVLGDGDGASMSPTSARPS